MKVSFLTLIYMGIMAYFLHGYKSEQRQLQTELVRLTEQQRNVQQSRLKERFALEQNAYDKRIEQHYAAWRADLELLEFAASFASGITLLERDGDRVSFIREFYIDERNQIMVTKDAVRELLYWGFNRLSVTNDNALKRGSWLLARRQ